MNRIWHFIPRREDNRYHWVARELETETELQYNRARCFDPSVGRWLSDDPLGHNADEANIYQYPHRDDV